MDFETKQKIFSESVDAHQCELMKYVVTLVDHKNGMSPASGIMFKILDRIIIATAGHVIPNDPSGRIWPVVRSVRHEKNGFPAYPKFARHPDFDVGYLEVHPEGAERYFGHHEYANLSQISCRGFGREDRSVIVVGSPGEHVQVTKHDSNTGTYNAKVMAYWTVPLLPNEWPAVPSADRPADTNIDIFLSYPTDDTIAAKGFDPINLPHPGGMSGGGIWDQEFKEDAIWDPTAIKLIGIQSCWHRKDRYLRAIQIVHWLRLIYRDFEDLRPILSTTFGEQVEIGV